MIVSEFQKLPILGILRGIKEDMIEPLVTCVLKSGLKSVEITMNTENAPYLINKMVKTAKDELIVGAGTVLSMKEMVYALEAGATFIVMPIINKDIVKYCVLNNIPVFPGAFTPNEIFYAWKLGATMVKVFPAKSLGAGYFKDVKAPLNNVRLMATGGVSAENIQEFFKNGADAVSFGASIFKPEWLAQGAYDKIEKEIKKLLDNYKNMP